MFLLFLGWEILYIFLSPSFVICVYIWVALRDSCPKSSWTLKMSHPSFKRWVAKVCLKTWGVILDFILVSLIIFLIINSTPLELKLVPELFINK